MVVHVGCWLVIGDECWLVMAKVMVNDGQQHCRGSQTKITNITRVVRSSGCQIRGDLSMITHESQRDDHVKREITMFFGLWTRLQQLKAVTWDKETMKYNYQPPPQRGMIATQETQY